MKVMVIVKASRASEAGEMPDTELLAAMGHFNEELSKAGVMLAGDGLHPSAKGARVAFSGKTRTVSDGPFAETKELIAGYWIWQVASMKEAIDWAKRCPNPHVEDCEIEIRPIFEADDFGEAFTPELQAQEDRIRAATEQRARQQNEASQSVTSLQQPLSPHLVIDGAAAAIEFYKQAFGAEEIMRMAGNDGRIMHAGVRINSAVVMIVDENLDNGMIGPNSLKGSPVTLHLNVADADAAANRAVAAGARLVMPVAEQFWGDRYGIVEDPFGHRWSISTPVREMSAAEIGEAAKRAMCDGPKIGGERANP